MTSAGGTERLLEDLRAQREFFVRGGRAPAYVAIVDAIERAVVEGPFAPRLAEAWRGREVTASAYDRPLLLLASMRFDALRDPRHPLADALVGGNAAAVTPERVAAALERPVFWECVRTRAVQTNETSRAVAWLLPATLVDAPMILADVGASAGLNLVGDALPAIWSVPVASSPRVVRRLGFDRAPVDVRDEDAADWLRACVWAGEGARLARLDEAIRLLRARTDVELVACDAAEVPSRLPKDGPFVLAYQTVVREYLPAPVARAYEQGMRAWLETNRRAMWVELEGSRHEKWPAAITVHVAAGDFVIARCGWHPSEVALDGGAMSALRPLLVTTA